jgi:capping protein beta
MCIANCESLKKDLGSSNTDIAQLRYYEGGTSSVYLWNLDDGFAGVVLLKKSSSQAAASGAWDSIHVLEVAERGRTAKYKLTSTVILNLGTKGDALGSLDLAGNMTRQVEADMSVDADETHVANIGKMVEDMELKMRNLLRKSRSYILRRFEDADTTRQRRCTLEKQRTSLET